MFRVVNQWISEVCLNVIELSVMKKLIVLSEVDCLYFICEAVVDIMVY
jgi:hypothetical protein